MILVTRIMLRMCPRVTSIIIIPTLLWYPSYIARPETFVVIL